MSNLSFRTLWKKLIVWANLEKILGKAAVLDLSKSRDCVVFGRELCHSPELFRAREKGCRTYSWKTFLDGSRMALGWLENGLRIAWEWLSETAQPVRRGPTHRSQTKRVRPRWGIRFRTVLTHNAVRVKSRDICSTKHPKAHTMAKMATVF